MENQSSISDGYINFSDLFADYNRRFDDDNFSGKYKGVTINICETELGKKSGSGKNSSYIVRFKGVLVNLLPEREFKSTILIKKKRLAKLCARRTPRSKPGRCRV